MGLVEHEQRAVAAADGGERRRRRAASPSIEKTVSVTTIDRAVEPSPRSCVEHVEVVVRPDGDVGAGQPGAVDDRRVVQLVADDAGAGGRRAW